MDATRWISALAAPLAPPILNADPHLADRERGARQHQELHEVATLDVQILRPVDGEILSPGGLCIGRREVRRYRDLLAFEVAAHTGWLALFRSALPVPAS